MENLTGIKAHTLRIWEQRYTIIQAKRTTTNIRYFDQDDLKFLLNIAMLNNNGFKISKIAALSKQEINDKVLEISERAGQDSDMLNTLTLSMLELDEAYFEKVLGHSVLKLGFEKAILQVIYPFLNRVGILWQTGGIVPAQEHFISNLIRQKLIVATDSILPTKVKYGKKIALFLPEGEYHEIGLLFANFIIKSKGHQTIYLGQSVPISDLSVIEEVYHPDYYFTLMTMGMPLELAKEYTEKLLNIFPNGKLVLGAVRPDMQTELSKFSGLKLVSDLEQMNSFVDDLDKESSLL